MDKMLENVKSIEQDGLLWGASKLIPIGYGIKKLQVSYGISIITIPFFINHCDQSNLNVESNINEINNNTLLQPN